MTQAAYQKIIELGMSGELSDGALGEAMVNYIAKWDPQYFLNVYESVKNGGSYMQGDSHSAQADRADDDGYDTLNDIRPHIAKALVDSLDALPTKELGLFTLIATNSAGHWIPCALGAMAIHAGLDVHALNDQGTFDPIAEAYGMVGNEPWEIFRANDRVARWSNEDLLDHNGVGIRWAEVREWAVHQAGRKE